MVPVQIEKIAGAQGLLTPYKSVSVSCTNYFINNITVAQRVTTLE